eukprot:2329018-Lingulodinium_polyedra.AAC.1
MGGPCCVGAAPAALDCVPTVGAAVVGPGAGARPAPCTLAAERSVSLFLVPALRSLPCLCGFGE